MPILKKQELSFAIEELGGFTSITELAEKLGKYKSVIFWHLNDGGFDINKINEERKTKGEPLFKILNYRTARSWREIIDAIEQEGGEASITVIANKLDKDRRAIHSIVKNMDFDLINAWRKKTGKSAVKVIRMEPEKTWQAIIEAKKQLGEDATQAQISRITGLSDSTVSDQIKKMRAEGIELLKVKHKNPAKTESKDIALPQIAAQSETPVASNTTEEAKPLKPVIQVVQKREKTNGTINFHLAKQLPGMIVKRAQNTENPLLEVNGLNGRRQSLIRNGCPPALATLLVSHFADYNEAVKALDAIRAGDLALIPELGIAQKDFEVWISPILIQPASTEKKGGVPDSKTLNSFIFPVFIPFLTPLIVFFGPVIPFIADQLRFVPSWMPAMKAMVINAEAKIKDIARMQIAKAKQHLNKIIRNRYFPAAIFLSMVVSEIVILIFRDSIINLVIFDYRLAALLVSAITNATVFIPDTGLPIVISLAVEYNPIVVGIMVD